MRLCCIYSLSRCAIEGLLAERGVDVADATILIRNINCGPLHARPLNPPKRRLGDTGFLYKFFRSTDRGNICDGLSIRLAMTRIVSLSPVEICNQYGDLFGCFR